MMITTILAAAILIFLLLVLGYLRRAHEIGTVDMRFPTYNTDRKFGAGKYWYRGEVIDRDGMRRPVLFSHDQLAVALKRAADNPEDVPSD